MGGREEGEQELAFRSGPKISCRQDIWTWGRLSCRHDNCPHGHIVVGRIRRHLKSVTVHGFPSANQNPFLGRNCLTGQTRSNRGELSLRNDIPADCHAVRTLSSHADIFCACRNFLSSGKPPAIRKCVDAYTIQPRSLRQPAVSCVSMRNGFGGHSSGGMIPNHFFAASSSTTSR